MLTAGAGVGVLEGAMELLHRVVLPGEPGPRLRRHPQLEARRRERQDLRLCTEKKRRVSRVYWYSGVVVWAKRYVPWVRL